MTRPTADARSDAGMFLDPLIETPWTNEQINRLERTHFNFVKEHGRNFKKSELLNFLKRRRSTGEEYDGDPSEFTRQYTFAEEDAPDKAPRLSGTATAIFKISKHQIALLQELDKNGALRDAALRLVKPTTQYDISKGEFERRFLALAKADPARVSDTFRPLGYELHRGKLTAVIHRAPLAKREDEKEEQDEKAQPRPTAMDRNAFRHHVKKYPKMLDEMIRQYTNLKPEQLSGQDKMRFLGQFYDNPGNRADLTQLLHNIGIPPFHIPREPPGVVRRARPAHEILQFRAHMLKRPEGLRALLDGLQYKPRLMSQAEKVAVLDKLYQDEGHNLTHLNDVIAQANIPQFLPTPPGPARPVRPIPRPPHQPARPYVSRPIVGAMGTPKRATTGVRRRPTGGPLRQARTPIVGRRPARRAFPPGRAGVPVTPARRIRGARPGAPRGPRGPRAGPRARVVRSVVGHRIHAVHALKSIPYVAHGRFTGTYWRESVTPRLSWQHLGPGHYIAKARRGMTSGIRQHVLGLLRRAKGYIWINGHRHSIKQAKGVLFDLLGKGNSVDIKLTNAFPFG